jgi:hypothetical protein
LSAEVSAGVGPGDCGVSAAIEGDQEPAATAERISSTILASTISRATLMPLTIARSLEDPCEMIQTPSTPRRIAPP